MPKAFDRILVVMFENQYRSYVMQDTFMEKLSRAGASMNNYFGCFHPSQTNYIASLAGEVCAVTNDTPPAAPLLQQTLVDLLEAKSVSWKAYMEGYPGELWNCAWQSSDYKQALQPMTEYPTTGDTLARYFRKHNAFASFHTIQADASRWAKIVPSDQLWNDVAIDSSCTLPEYSWFTPDIWNDGHYLYNTHVDTNPRTQLVPQLSGWLENVFFADIDASNVAFGSASGQPKLGLNLDVDLLLTDPQKAWKQSRVPEGTLIVVTFDEADYDAKGYDTNYDGPNQVYTVLLGDMIAPGTNIDVPFNHYGLIKTVEKNFDLASLEKNDQQANWFRFLWQEDWLWGAASDTPISQCKAMAAATLNNQLAIAYTDDSGLLQLWSAKGGQVVCSDIHCEGNIAASVLGDSLFVVYTDSQASLHSVVYSIAGGWSIPVEVGVTDANAFAMCAFVDEADQNTQKLMLCWQPGSGYMQSKLYDTSAWSLAPVSVGQITDGDMAIAQLGGLLLLVYKQRNTRRLSMTTYNVAPYNAFDALTFENTPAPENNTSLHQWSPADQLVGHFGGKMSNRQHTYQASGQLAMAAIEGEVHLAYRDTYADTSQVYGTYFGLTGIFTAANQASNNYGTMQQAGWTEEVPVTEVTTQVTSQLCMASNNEKVWILWQANMGLAVQQIQGGYCDSPLLGDV